VKTLRDLAALLFRVDPPPSARLSHVLGVRQRQAQYWLSGRDPTPPDVIQTMEGQIVAVRDFDLQGRIDDVVRAAEGAGIKRSVVAHYLDQTVDSLRDTATDS
jgi:hypothetical protein